MAVSIATNVYLVSPPSGGGGSGGGSGSGDSGGSTPTTGSDLLSWIDPNGIETPLNGENEYLALVGRQGFFAPPTDLIVDAIPLQPGEREKYVQVRANEVRVPILIQSDTEANLLIARRALRRSLNPSRGLGILRSTAPDGSVRDLSCRLVDGLRGDESDGARGPGWCMAGLIFHAADPYWYDKDDTLQTFAMSGSPVLFFDPPFFPLKMALSGIASDFTVDNTSDVECWPIWVITGPGSAMVLTNNTTDEALTLTMALSAGQVLTIDTRPGKKTVRREDGSNQFSAIDPTSSLWSLQPGNNTISLSLTGTTGASQLQLRYKQRYEGT
jgi:hypothetical protein